MSRQPVSPSSVNVLFLARRTRHSHACPPRTTPTMVESAREIKDGPPKASTSAERGAWGSQLQFLLSCIGFAVGLGNIWRFPALAYENGGGAFLLPYVCCSLLFGLPTLFFEFSIGQFTSSGPSVAYAKYLPAMHGVGWAMPFISISIGIYYNVILAWACVYVYKIVTLQTSQFTSCENYWNTEYCTSTLMDELCAQRNSSTPIWMNKACRASDYTFTPPGNLSFMAPAEEFFENYVLLKTSSIDDLGEVNWKILGSLFLMWCVTALALVKGVKWMGRISMVTATVPYVIIAVLFVRGVTLEGAVDGIRFYLLEPDFSKALKFQTWKAALTQVCFTLGLGQGGLLSMSSYNSFKHNSFRDALIVCFADTFMSVFGGVAVFSTMGFLARKMNVHITEVVQSGTGVAFVAHLEAAGRMPASWLWSLLFMVMLLLLGISTQFGYTEVMITSIVDQWPSLQHRKWLVVCGVTFFNFCAGSIMCTGSGIYWFNIFNECSGSFALCLMCVSELVIIIHVYGISNMVSDLEAMFGKPRNMVSRVFGPTGYAIRLNWMLVAPVLGATVMVLTLMRDPMTYGKGGRMVRFPWWAEAFGWTLGSLPIIFVPIFFVYQYRKWSQLGDTSQLWKVQPTLRSYKRIHGYEEKTTAYSYMPMDEDGRADEEKAREMFGQTSQRSHAPGSRASCRDAQNSPVKSRKDALSSRREQSTHSEKQPAGTSSNEVTASTTKSKTKVV